MATRIPIVLDETNSQLRELPVGDDLDLTGNNITGLTSITTTSTITAGGSITTPLLLATDATVSGNVEALTFTVGGSNLLESIDFDDLLNKPTIPVDVADLTDTGGLLGGGFSGDYNDLLNKPFIPVDVRDLEDVDGTIPTDISDLTDNGGLLASGTFEGLSDAFTFDGKADQIVIVNNAEDNLATITQGSILAGLTGAQVTDALGYTPYNDTNPDGYISDSIGITDALGYTPYDGATNPSGYITGIDSNDVTGALGFTPYNATNPAGFINDSTGVISVLGYVPYNGTSNPNGFLNAEVDTLDTVVTRGSTTTTAISTGALTSGGRVTGTDLELTTGGININHTNATTIDTSNGGALTIGGQGNITLDSFQQITINQSIVKGPSNVNLGTSGGAFDNIYVNTVNTATISNNGITVNAGTGVVTLQGTGVVNQGNYLQAGSGADGDRPASPQTGTYMYNTTHGYHQVYDGGRDFVNAGGTGLVTGGWLHVVPPIGGTPNADDTYPGMLAIADGTAWNPAGDGSECLMVFLNNQWNLVF